MSEKERQHKTDQAICWAILEGFNKRGEDERLHLGDSVKDANGGPAATVEQRHIDAVALFRSKHGGGSGYVPGSITFTIATA